MDKMEKREVPSMLRKLLAVDAYLSNAFVNWAEQIIYLKQLKVHHAFLEVSCHGIAWLATNLVLIWIFNNSNLYQMQVNLLLGLVLDIILITVLKALTRRRRPITDDYLSRNKDSFPSGLASRAAFVVYFFLNIWPIPLICAPPLLAWSFSVCMSRLLIKKHHILDVLAGIALGILQGLLIEYIYLEQETCSSLVWWITDEKISGAEYDV